MSSLSINDLDADAILFTVAGAVEGGIDLIAFEVIARDVLVGLNAGVETLEYRVCAEFTWNQFV